MIRSIIFDCFGVLYGGSYQALRAVCPSDKLDDLTDLNHQADYGFITTEEYIRGCAELIGKSYEEVEALFRTKHVRNDELISYVKSLKGKVKLGLLSNVSNDVIEHLFSSSDLALFDEVLLSYREHITKPNPAVYLLLVERLGVRADECVMVDDILENCEGAEVAGLESILYVNNEQAIESLSKLLSP